MSGTTLQHGAIEVEATGATVAPLATSPAVSPAELAEVMAAVNEVAVRLGATHESLRAEVSRLRRELHEANEALERSRRLAALGELAAGIAHEIRNPLGSIRLYASVLVEDLADRPALRDTAARIGEGVRRLDAVVSDVLAFAREARPRLERVRAGELLAHALDAAAPGTGHAGRSGPNVLCPPVPPDAGCLEVDCDPALAHRALVNVIRNALEAMAECPGREHELRLSARAVGAGGDDGGAPDGEPGEPAAPADIAGVALVVSDTGVGVPEGARDRLFNPFFTTKAQGTGLGLAIVHRIMDAHAGRVRIGNNARAHGPGAHGATVELIFPRRADAPAVAGSTRGDGQDEGPRGKEAAR